MKIAALCALGAGVIASIFAIILILRRGKRSTAANPGWMTLILIVAVIFIIMAVFNAVLVLTYF